MGTYQIPMTTSFKKVEVCKLTTHGLQRAVTRIHQAVSNGQGTRKTKKQLKRPVSWVKILQGSYSKTRDFRRTASTRVAQVTYLCAKKLQNPISHLHQAYALHRRRQKVRENFITTACSNLPGMLKEITQWIFESCRGKDTTRTALRSTCACAHNAVSKLKEREAKTIRKTLTNSSLRVCQDSIQQVKFGLYLNKPKAQVGQRPQREVYDYRFVLSG